MSAGATDGGGERIGGLALVTASARDALARRLADDVAAALARGLDGRGRGALVVSGGTTPAPMFAALAAREDIDWSSVTVTLADERWVPPSDAASNERLVRETLLVGAAAAARFVPLYVDLRRPTEEALARVDAALEAMPRPFDAVVLGMGTDGHTASLFPDAPELERGMDDRRLAVAPMHPPSAPQARISLTRATLVDARSLFVHVTGEDKRAVLERALADEPRLAPIARVLDAAVDRATIYWSA